MIQHYTLPDLPYDYAARALERYDGNDSGDARATSVVDLRHIRHSKMPDGFQPDR
jgi:hypothetical protein